VVEGIEAVLAEKFARLLPHLDERRRRLVLGADARAVGYGGVRLVARAAGVSEETVSRGVAELAGGPGPSGRVRREGGGRRRLREKHPGLVPALLALVEPDQRGDPESPLLWTTKSTRKLAGELTAQGFRVGSDTVAALLKEEGFSLQGTSRTTEGARHPDRDAQFHHINGQVREFTGAGEPVISVDAKKKEVLGDYAVIGREWHRSGEPVRVRAHDYPEKNAQKAVPYGIYGLSADTGWVSVGCDGDTSAFAVATLRRWWDGEGRHRYPHATRLLITADAGGSNGYRVKAWKKELADFALDTGLAVTVCHFPPGTSKWNKIEHRLFSRISTNWRGRPLTSHEVVVNTIGAVTTNTGLTVHAEFDPGRYPTGVTVSDDVMERLPLTPPTSGTAPGTTRCVRNRSPHRFRRCHAIRRSAGSHPGTRRPPGSGTPVSPAWNPQHSMTPSSATAPTSPNTPRSCFPVNAPTAVPAQAAGACPPPTNLLSTF